MPEPSDEQWLDLHMAFREYCEAKPWEWLDDSNIVTIEHPGWNYKGHAAVLGSGGIEFGLGVYRGDEGLAGYLGSVTGAFDTESSEVLDITNAVSALLADRELLPKEDRDVIRSLGLRYRGRGSWPLFQSAEPGYLPWRLNSDDAAVLAVSLRCMTDLAELVRTGKESLDDSMDDSSLFLTRTFRNGAWINRWEQVISPVPPPVLDYPDLERLRQLAESKPRESETWELSIFYLHVPVREQRGARPHFPVMAMLVHSEFGYLVQSPFMRPDPSDTDRQELLVEALEALPALPSEIVVNAPRLTKLVESVTSPLGIALSVDETPALWAAQEELLDTLEPF